MSRYTPTRPFRPRCLFAGMIFGWVAALYVPSLLFALFGLAPPGTPEGIVAATWHLTDEIGPVAKLAFAAIAGALLIGTRRIAMGASLRTVADAALGTLAMLLLLAFLPERWSRGIGIGLTGARFTMPFLAIYLAGGALAGLAFNLADRKCGELARPVPHDD